MNKPLIVTMLAMLAIAFATVGPDAAGAQQTTELRIATVAPEGSPWMRVFRAWDEEVRERTGGSLGLRVYPGGSQGQESDYIDKMASGQLDGAAVTTNGLGQIVRPTLVLAVPGLFTEYDQLDRVRRRLRGRFNRQFQRNGYQLLGWGDVGKGRLFSNRRVERPQDLRQTRPWAPRNDEVFSQFLSVAGARPHHLGIPEVQSALSTGTVNAVPASALAAVLFQWHSHLRFFTQQSTGVLIGATILKKERFDALPEDQQTALRETARRAHRLLNRAIRREDERSLRVITQRLTAVDTSPHEAAWTQAAEQNRDALVGRV